MSTCIALDAAAITALASSIVQGYAILANEMEALLAVKPGSSAFAAVLEGACSIRRQCHGSRLSFCSILNAKAGNCSEDCCYCAQARGIDDHDYEAHPWLDDEAIHTAAGSCIDAGAGALSLVAAWRGLQPGRRLDMVCESITELAGLPIRADASLGLIDDPAVAEALAAAGLQVYHHNLETARSHFAHTCTSHRWEDRLITCRHVKQAGMQLCCGGILGIGERPAQRAEFAEQLSWVDPEVVPLNFITPIPGTPSAALPTLDPDTALLTLAVFRFALPGPSIVLAGGKEATFGARLHEVLGSGIDAVMVGNYLTSLGTSADYWRAHAASYGFHI